MSSLSLVTVAPPLGLLRHIALGARYAPLAGLTPSARGITTLGTWWSSLALLGHVPHTKGSEDAKPHCSFLLPKVSFR